jgi:hypothetical protein
MLLFPFGEGWETGAKREFADVAAVNAEGHGVKEGFCNFRTESAGGKIVDRFVGGGRGGDEELADEIGKKRGNERAERAEFSAVVDVPFLRGRREDFKLKIIEEREEMRTSAQEKGSGAFFEEKAPFMTRLNPTAKAMSFFEEGNFGVGVFAREKPSGAKAGNASAENEYVHTALENCPLVR